MIHYSQIANGRCMLKGQDIVVLLAHANGAGGGESYAALGARTHVSVSEAHAAVRRLQEAGLLDSGRRMVNRNVSEFLLHGLRYTFPLRSSGKMAKGIPTAYAAPVADGAFATTGAIPVWKSGDGAVYGKAFDPIYVTAPQAAAENRSLYDWLAVVDMLRGGRLRERQFAQSRIQEMMS